MVVRRSPDFLFSGGGGISPSEASKSGEESRLPGKELEDGAGYRGSDNIRDTGRWVGVERVRGVQGPEASFLPGLEGPW